jgi:hypothetical protein
MVKKDWTIIGLITDFDEGDVSEMLYSVAMQEYERKNMILATSGLSEKNISILKNILSHFSGLLDLELKLYPEQPPGKTLNLILPEVDDGLVSWITPMDRYYFNFGSKLVRSMAKQGDITMGYGKTVSAYPVEVGSVKHIESKIFDEDKGLDCIQTVFDEKYVPLSASVLQVDAIRAIRFNERLRYLFGWGFVVDVRSSEKFSGLYVDDYVVEMCEDGISGKASPEKIAQERQYVLNQKVLKEDFVVSGLELEHHRKKHTMLEERVGARRYQLIDRIVDSRFFRFMRRCLP